MFLRSALCRHVKVPLAHGRYFASTTETLHQIPAPAAQSKKAPEQEPASKLPVVNSHNEWDPLEEVIVGHVHGARFPSFEVSVKATSPPDTYNFMRQKSGEGFPPELVNKASRELDYFCHVLEQEGVVVKRPPVVENDFDKPYKTPDFESKAGLYAAMPRDILMVMGDTIVEAPMSWRCRFFEFRHFRPLIKDYFKKGGKWVCAPKSAMSDKLYNFDWKHEPGNMNNWSITEFDPVFDAADFMRLGRDIIYQHSHATNEFGVDWLRRTFPEYRFHRVSMTGDELAFHIDVTFVPLGPGKVMIEGERPPNCGSINGWYTFEGQRCQYRLPDMFKGWDVFVAPRSVLPEGHCYFSSNWVASSNVLMLDPERVFVEAHEEEVIKLFKRWGFKPIPIPFRSVLPFGGGFHCVTTDIRRRGTLQSYF